MIAAQVEKCHRCCHRFSASDRLWLEKQLASVRSLKLRIPWRMMVEAQSAEEKSLIVTCTGLVVGLVYHRVVGGSENASRLFAWANL